MTATTFTQQELREAQLALFHGLVADGVDVSYVTVSDAASHPCLEVGVLSEMSKVPAIFCGVDVVVRPSERAVLAVGDRALLG